MRIISATNGPDVVYWHHSKNGYGWTNEKTDASKFSDEIAENLVRKIQTISALQPKLPKFQKLSILDMNCE